MKNQEKVADLIAQLKAEIETPYELAAVERLERELVEGAPKVEIIDEKHCKFQGLLFHKQKDNHYYRSLGLQQAIWVYHFGTINDGYEIHHKDWNASNNDISNLQALTKSEHTKIHATKTIAKNYKNGTIEVKCENCGKIFSAMNIGRNKFCSAKCLEKYRDKTKRRFKIKICDFCGKEFLTQHPKTSKCCSKSCGNKLDWQKRKSLMPKVFCEYCGKEMLSPKKGTRFCSRSCASKAQHQKKF